MPKKTKLLRIAAALAFSTICFAVGPLWAQREPSKSPTPSGSSASVRSAAAQARAATASQDEVTLLKQQVAQQQVQIDQLLQALKELKDRIEQPKVAAARPAPGLAAAAEQVASLKPAVPALPAAADAALPAAPDPDAPVTRAALAQTDAQVSGLQRTVDALDKGLAGFKFSGDLRFRTDGIFRTANSFGSQQQNVRERYRVRLNINKDISNEFGFHLQLASGTAQNPTTFDSDFAFVNTRGPIWLSEYYADFHPNHHFSVRAGKMEEVFADNSKFFFDDDVRFNGMQEIVKGNTGSSAVHTVSFMAGQYLLTNPNVIVPSQSSCTAAPAQVITTLPATISTPATPSANCAFLAAGYAPGSRVRDAAMFDQGVRFEGNINGDVKDKLEVQFQAWRNPNQLLIATTSTGGPVLVNGNYGLTLAGGVGQPGNGTTTKGGLIFTASDYRIGRLDYRIDWKGGKTSRQSWPLFLDFQGAHNFGADFYGNAFMGTIGVGEAGGPGHVRLMYFYTLKEADSMISEVTDDDIGIGVGTNLRAHMARVDLGLTRKLQWQNVFYLMQPFAPNDPARNFFVPFQLGAKNTYRFQSQFQFSF